VQGDVHICGIGEKEIPSDEGIGCFGVMNLPECRVPRPPHGVEEVTTRNDVDGKVFCGSPLVTPGFVLTDFLNVATMNLIDDRKVQ
jgi:hypothetical protein